MKTCSSCKKLKKKAEFNKKAAAKKDGLQPMCRRCNRIQARAYYKKNKATHLKKVYKTKQTRIRSHQKKIFAFLQANPCVDCGFSNPLALDFDHVRGQKQANVTTLLKEGYSWDIIEKEIRKCEIRCRNCHGIKTHKEQKSYRNKLFQVDEIKE